MSAALPLWFLPLHPIRQIQSLLTAHSQIVPRPSSLSKPGQSDIRIGTPASGVPRNTPLISTLYLSKKAEFLASAANFCSLPNQDRTADITL